jgi:hypothetical protein
MELLVGVIIVITVIGAIVASIFSIAIFAAIWWIVIPIICGMVLGPIGFLFGLGLVVIIGLIIAVIKR